MPRKKSHGGHENHERWLVSYADFITLLFAFFVVMFASSQADRGKAQQVSDSVRKALEENQVAAALAGILGGAPQNRGKGNAMMKGPGGTTRQQHPPIQAKDLQMAELLPSQRFLSEALAKEIAAGKVQVHMEPRGLVVTLRESALFSTGDDAISPSAHPTIEQIASSVRQLPNPVRLEGHTDSVPIHNSRFRSNWELSAARSIAMLELLAVQHGVPREKMSIAGYAETAPVDSNETDEGRAHNRRVDVVILNEKGLVGEPKKPEPSRPSPMPVPSPAAGTIR